MSTTQRNLPQKWQSSATVVGGSAGRMQNTAPTYKPGTHRFPGGARRLEGAVAARRYLTERKRPPEHTAA